MEWADAVVSVGTETSCGGYRNRAAVDNLREWVRRIDMSMKLSRSTIGMMAVVVGLIAATALVAGYVDRPGTCSRSAVAAKGDCGGCPVKGTEECPKEAGMCPAEDGTCPMGACCGGSATGSCPVAKTADAGPGCPMKAAVAAAPCGAGGCPAR